jgi:hypothetical protein
VGDATLPTSLGSSAAQVFVLAILTAVRLFLVLLAAGIAFFATCVASLAASAPDNVLLVLSGLAGLAGLVLSAYLLFFRWRRTKRPGDPS